jgi:CheY-like chemotaxis protein
VDAYLTKPIRQAQLVDCLVTMLGRGGASQSSGRAAPAPEAGRQAGARVLIVDDNAVNRAVIVGMLEVYECVTAEAGNGGEAVTAVREGSFDLVFMDCQMPVLDGFEATAEIRRVEQLAGRRRVPIVALTASALKGERERCLAAGMDDYLSKPVRQSELGDAVRRWVSGSSAAEIGGAVVTFNVSTPAALSTPANAVGHANGSSASNGSAPSSNGVLDPTVIDAIRAMPSKRPGDTLSRLVGIYLEHTPVAIRHLRAAVDSGGCAEAQRISHTIKSSTGMLGASGLARLLNDAETAGQAGAHADLTRLIDEIELEYQRVHSALSELLPSGPNA